MIPVPSPPFSGPRQADRRALTLIFIIIFMDLLAIGILVPVLPFLALRFRTDATTVGMLTMLYSAGQFVACPLLGVLSDRFGRRPILLLSILGSAIANFTLGLASSLAVMFAARVFDGLTGGNVSTAQAYIADVSPPEERSKNFALIGAAFGLGFILGPAAGGLLSKISLSAPAFAAGTVSTITCVCCYFFLPESLPKEGRRASGGWRELNPFSQVFQAMSRPSLALLLWAVFALNFAASGLQTNFAVFSFVRFGMDPFENGVLLVFVGVAGLFTQGYLIRGLIPRFGDSRLAIFGLGATALSFAGIALAPGRWSFGAASCLYAFGIGLAGPCLTGLLSRRVPFDQQGSLLGTTQSVASMTRIVGPLWAGAAFDSLGPGAPYWTGAAWVMVALWLAALGRRGEPRD